LVDSR